MRLKVCVLFVSIGQCGRQNGVNLSDLAFLRRCRFHYIAAIVTLSQEHHHGNICIINV
jgi:hypothetical protein